MKKRKSIFAGIKIRSLIWAFILFVMGGILSPTLTKIGSRIASIGTPKVEDLTISGCAPMEESMVIIELIPTVGESPSPQALPLKAMNVTELKIHNTLETNFDNAKITVYPIVDDFYESPQILGTRVSTNSIESSRRFKVIKDEMTILIETPSMRGGDVVTIMREIDHPARYYVEFESDQLSKKQLIDTGCRDYKQIRTIVGFPAHYSYNEECVLFEDSIVCDPSIFQTEFNYVAEVEGEMQVSYNVQIMGERIPVDEIPYSNAYYYGMSGTGCLIRPGIAPQEESCAIDDFPSEVPTDSE